MSDDTTNSLVAAAVAPASRTAKATIAAAEAHRRHAAERAINDPVRLGQAVRVVRTALERDRLDLGELLPTEYVERKIEQAVAGAPALPSALSARLVELIRADAATAADLPEAC